MEKISKDESFSESSIANGGENNQDIQALPDDDKSGLKMKKIKFEKNPLNFIYPQFIVILY